MQRIEEMSDADVSEVRESASLFRQVEGTTADLRGVLDFLCGMRWLTAGMKKKERDAFESPIMDALGLELDDAFSLLADGPDVFLYEDSSEARRLRALWRTTPGLLPATRAFLHWEVAFPRRLAALAGRATQPAASTP